VEVSSRRTNRGRLRTLQKVGEERCWERRPRNLKHRGEREDVICFRALEEDRKYRGVRVTAVLRLFPEKELTTFKGKGGGLQKTRIELGQQGR